MSRPTLVKLLESGEIPFEQPGRHRRVRLADVLAYRERASEGRRAALDRMVEIATFNVRDVPASSVEAFEIEIIDPDTFLLDQLDLAPAAVVDELTRPAVGNQRQPKTLPGLLDALGESRRAVVRRRTPTSNHVRSASATC